MDIRQIKESLALCAEELHSKIGAYPHSKDDVYIYMAGGAALVLQEFADRATRDIDVLKHNAMDTRGIDGIFAKYNINCAVMAYFDDFPVGFSSRAKKVDVGYTGGGVHFYALSIEDLVISKLCSTRLGKDIADIESPRVTDVVNWELLETLADSMEASMISTRAYGDFRYKYDRYVEDFCKERKHDV